MPNTYLKNYPCPLPQLIVGLLWFGLFLSAAITLPLFLIRPWLGIVGIPIGAYLTYNFVYLRYKKVPDVEFGLLAKAWMVILATVIRTFNPNDRVDAHRSHVFLYSLLYLSAPIYAFGTSVVLSSSPWEKAIAGLLLWLTCIFVLLVIIGHFFVETDNLYRRIKYARQLYPYSSFVCPILGLVFATIIGALNTFSTITWTSTISLFCLFLIILPTYLTPRLEL